MAPDLPDKLLGIDIDGTDRTERAADEDEPDDEEYVRIVPFRVGEHRLAVPVDAVRTTTDAPDDLTPVPRTPPAVEGVTDLRGEITAVIDPSVHFPTDELDGDQLLVFDRPADEQSAAIRVDEVIQVDTVPEGDIFEDADTAADEYDVSTDVLEHPLVSALVVQERRPRQRLGETVVTPESTGTGDAGGSSGSSGASATLANAPHSERIVVEVTPLVDIDRLLAAAGPETRPQ